MSSATGLVFTGPRQFEQREIALPAIGPDDGLLRVEACALCGTDHEQVAGDLPHRHSIIPGHEVVGVVEELGDAAAERWRVEPGQRVAVEVFSLAGTASRSRYSGDTNPSGRAWQPWSRSGWLLGSND